MAKGRDFFDDYREFYDTVKKADAKLQARISDQIAEEVAPEETEEVETEEVETEEVETEEVEAEDVTEETKTEEVDEDGSKTE